MPTLMYILLFLLIFMDRYDIWNGGIILLLIFTIMIVFN